jgi:MGT family glycosyltransferase
MFPAIAISRALVAQDHRVAFHTDASYEGLLRSLGCEVYPVDSGLDAVPLREEAGDPSASKAAFRARFLDRVPADMVSLQRVVASWCPDVLVNDPVTFAPLLVGERADIPVATLNNVIFSWPGADMGPYGLGLPPARGEAQRSYYAMLRARAEAFYADVVADLNALRAACNLPPRAGSLAEATLSPYLHVVPTIPELDYHRADLPPQVHHVGPCLYDPPYDSGAEDDVRRALDWLTRLPAGRSPLLVAASSVFKRSAQLIEAALDCLAGRQVHIHGLSASTIEVLATLPFEHDLLGRTPYGHSFLARFVPHSAVLPHCSAVVTHGGFGMVTKALSYGLPLVVVPYAADQPEVAQRVVAAGAGLRLNPDRLTFASLRDAVLEVLRDGDLRAAAQRLAQEMRAYDGPATAARLLADLAATGRPILRTGAATGLVAPTLAGG